MKKFLLLFCAISLALTSCSSDDDSSDSVLLKKVVITGSGGKTTVNYTYDGNKLVSVVDDFKVINMHYTYTGDLITKIDFKLPDGSIEQTNSFSYGTDGKLTTFVRVEFDEDDFKGYKEVYTYNANGTISVKAYSGDDKTQTNATGTSTITFVNGDVSEITSTNSPNHKYTYDDKNNSAKNVLGLDKIAFVDGEGTDVFHNELSDTSDGEVWSTYSFTYNSDGYPEKSTSNEEGEDFTSEFFY
ncbi:hypothetical protein IRZ71_22790 [Flavobacterium sp. ANB]|uniref:hypothetical protein n=1 Tax=unclassified Flavobacterium TaxID=196869 RepID=UPI0012BA31F8|nr:MULTISPECIES: hypothetical protein [unclassified Flavobacterium]MBF4519189.1 hypothetical protein [Flavobacterium sp. ANB]MTD72007.1 hypothetical protein [Flavobacterium sp. LC2016-13]